MVIVSDNVTMRNIRPKILAKVYRMHVRDQDITNAKILVLQGQQKFFACLVGKNVFFYPTTKKNCVFKNLLTKMNFFSSFLSLFFNRNFHDGLLSKLNCLIEEGMEKAEISPFPHFYVSSLPPCWSYGRTFLPPSKWGYSYSTHNTPPPPPALQIS
jgi:hypothetical protein